MRPNVERRLGRGLNIRDNYPAGMQRKPLPVELDSRGILDPRLLAQRITLTRYPVGEQLAGLLDRYWAVEWDLPPGATHTQPVLTHPCGNLSVGHGEPDGAGAPGPIEARLHGVYRGLSRRTLAGRGWTVAAMTTPGGLGALTTRPASTYTDKSVPLGLLATLDEAALVADLQERPDQPGRVEAFARAIESAVRAVDPDRLRTAREVAEVTKLAETDRPLRRAGDLARAAAVSVRTLQRLFADYVGVSPTWVLRRYRLIDVAEQVRGGQRVSWADVAAGLGYADQAHLTRDFRAATGRTPSEYAAAQR